MAGVADRAYVVEKGRISFSGPPEELRRRETLEEAYFGTGSRHSEADTGGGGNA